MSELVPIAALNDERLALIAQSYQRLTGKPLLETPFDALALWHAPQAIVAHGTEQDPVFFYGNRLALQSFEMSFDEFTRLPSRFSAEPLAREARAALLERVARLGFVNDYSGVRIASSGRRFTISNATVWNLLDAADGYQGQAAAFLPPQAAVGCLMPVAGSDQQACQALHVLPRG